MVCVNHVYVSHINIFLNSRAHIKVSFNKSKLLRFYGKYSHIELFLSQHKKSKPSNQLPSILRCHVFSLRTKWSIDLMALNTGTAPQSTIFNHTWFANLNNKVWRLSRYHTGNNMYVWIFLLIVISFWSVSFFNCLMSPLGLSLIFQLSFIASDVDNQNSVWKSYFSFSSSNHP